MSNPKFILSVVVNMGICVSEQHTQRVIDTRLIVRSAGRVSERDVAMWSLPPGGQECELSVKECELQPVKMTAF